MQITIAEKTIKLDKAQLAVFNQLEALKKQLVKLSKKNSTRLKIKSIFGNISEIPNFYIHGKVGRGKSMLMRHFFENLPLPKKIYFHFNSFMQEVHAELHGLRKEKSDENRDLIALATKAVIDDAQILCFDEMQVEDVADAMILQGVFTYFIHNKITVITTSNCHPTELYQNGLQRDLFLKFVNQILLKNFSVLSLDGKIDYRSQFLGTKKHYFSPNNSGNKKEILDIWLALTEGNQPTPKEIEILGRKLIIKNTYKNIALFDFKELCIDNLGVADYQAICRKFSVIFLLNIPILKAEDRNEAKRLILFIDEAYENKIDLLVLAECEAEEIYIEGTGFEAFKRAVSRLNEITNRDQ